MIFQVGLRIFCKKCRKNLFFTESFAPEDFEDLDTRDFEDAAVDWLKNHNFVRSENDTWLCANCCKTGEPQNLVITYEKKAVNPPVVRKPNTPISGNFLRRVQAAGCQCERQKLEGMPLCGVCYSNLTKSLQHDLRNKKGGELEEAYDSACEFLKGKTSQFLQKELRKLKVNKDD